MRRLVRRCVWFSHCLSIGGWIYIAYEITHSTPILEEASELSFDDGSVFIIILFSFFLCHHFLSWEIFHHVGEVVLGSRNGVQNISWDSDMRKTRLSIVKRSFQMCEEIHSVGIPPSPLPSLVCPISGCPFGILSSSPGKSSKLKGRARGVIRSASPVGFA